MIHRTIRMALVFMSCAAIPACQPRRAPSTAVDDVKRTAVPTTQEAAVPYACHRASGPITIDGLPEDADWKAAPWITYFQQAWKEGESRRPRTATRAKLLWDAEYLYFFADMEDANLYANTDQHQGLLWFGDVFEIFLKPSEDKPAYYEFEFNPANATLELAFPGRGLAKFEDVLANTKIEVKTAVKIRGTVNHPDDHDEGWSVEGRIRWSDLKLSGGGPAENAAWHFALCRNDTVKDEKNGDLSSSAPLTKPNFHRYEDYPVIRFVK